MDKSRLTEEVRIDTLRICGGNFGSLAEELGEEEHGGIVYQGVPLSLTYKRHPEPVEWATFVGMSWIRQAHHDVLYEFTL